MRVCLISLLVIAVIVAEPCVGQDTDPADDPGWALFLKAADCLREEGDRAKAGALFDEVATQYPDADFADDAEEFATLLGVMVEEDKAWVEPGDVGALSRDEMIAYYIYHLRDVHVFMLDDEGGCSVLHTDQSPYQAAIRLNEMGEAAVPALIGLLDDRRPTRSVSLRRSRRHACSVVRFQDAAMQVLNELLPVRFYRSMSSGAYLSTESPEYRQRVIDNVRAWYQKSRGKGDLARKWAAAELDLGIYPLCDLLLKLAKEPGQKGRVIERLNALAREKPPLQLPQVSYTLCRVGDQSLLPKVHDGYFAGEYHDGVMVSFWDDGCASMNANEIAVRQLILYGDAKCREKLWAAILASGQDNIGQPGANILLELFAIAENQFGWTMPEEYDREQFPMDFLVKALQITFDSKTYVASQYTTRWCDRAAHAIQKFTGQDFGYNEKASVAEKDAAIAKIHEWWKEQANRTK